jgi:ElaB/YqjD/DUF883 family membrane-anchored ribosome-binding protein
MRSSLLYQGGQMGQFPAQHLRVRIYGTIGISKILEANVITCCGETPEKCCQLFDRARCIWVDAVEPARAGKTLKSCCFSLLAVCADHAHDRRETLSAWRFPVGRRSLIFVKDRSASSFHNYPDYRGQLEASPFSKRFMMFGHSGYSRAMSANVSEIERRLRSIEKRLERLGVRTSASAVETADHVGETVAAVLSSIAERFRGGAGLMGDEAAKIGSEAAKLGNDALRRLSREVEHRPLVTLAVAVGVGILVGLISHRR